MRIGRGVEHIGALVNTLCYSLCRITPPVVFIFLDSAIKLTLIVNREIFATEIVRALIGSIGLVLAVPIYYLTCDNDVGKNKKSRISVLQKKMRRLNTSNTIINFFINVGRVVGCCRSTPPPICTEGAIATQQRR